MSHAWCAGFSPSRTSTSFYKARGSLARQALYSRVSQTVRPHRLFSASSRRAIRLINVKTLELHDFNPSNTPEYAILSHTWGDAEVSLQEWQLERSSPSFSPVADAIRDKAGYRKILGACDYAWGLGYEYVWCDTNCIDKTSSAELSEAINSMFTWYRQADICFAYLEDVERPSAEWVARFLLDDRRRLRDQYARMAAQNADIVGIPYYDVAIKPKLNRGLNGLAMGLSDITVGAEPTSSRSDALKASKIHARRRKHLERHMSVVKDIMGLGYEVPIGGKELAEADWSLENPDPAGGSAESAQRAAIDPEVQALTRSRWFTRGWTLQELLAPRKLRFLAKDWSPLGRRKVLGSIISEITGIQEDCVTGRKQISEFSIAQRMAWASKRQTTRVEDTAYSLLGIFDIHMPLLYGEGMHAFKRLQEAIMRTSPDQSILAWAAWPGIHDRAYDNAADVVPYFAPTPEAFNTQLRRGRPVLVAEDVGAGLNGANRGNWLTLPTEPFTTTTTNMGLSVQMPLLRTANPDIVLAGLNYVADSHNPEQVWLPLHAVRPGKNLYRRMKLFRQGLIFPVVDQDKLSEPEHIYISDDMSLPNGLDWIDIADRPTPKVTYLLAFGKNPSSYELVDVAASRGCLWYPEYSALLTGRSDDSSQTAEFAVLVFRSVASEENKARDASFAVVLWTTHKARGTFSDTGAIVLSDLEPPSTGLAGSILEHVEQSRADHPDTESLDGSFLQGLAARASRRSMTLRRFGGQGNMKWMEGYGSRSASDGAPTVDASRVTIGRGSKWAWKMRIFDRHHAPGYGAPYMPHPEEPFGALSSSSYSSQGTDSELEAEYREAHDHLLFDWHDEANQFLVPVRIDFAP
jgi:hypothetical protein